MPEFSGTDLLAGIGYLLIFFGLVGSVLPVLPGPLLIWLGAFLWAWGDDFQRVGWPTLVVLGVLALSAWAADLFLSTVMSRRAGASWKAILGAIAGGVVGGILLSGIPIIGTLVGAVLGGMSGMYLVEYADKRDFAAAWLAVRAYLWSMVLSAMIEVTIALGMIGIFAWQAWR